MGNHFRTDKLSRIPGFQMVRQRDGCVKCVHSLIKPYGDGRAKEGKVYHCTKFKVFVAQMTICGAYEKENRHDPYAV